ncbi:MAG TPA: gamma-glutamyltransferase [Kofleriaceae bacterium]|nr:gamma-glutamyltransferase [Kofleriaceae bacterium]
MALSVMVVATVALVARPDSVDAAHAPPLTTTGGAVASDDPTASAVGARVLAEGGDAADAAVATAFALGVVNPVSSGIGGGGFAVVYDARTHTTHVYDFREVAPAALGPDDFLVDGKLDPDRSRTGGLAVGVPGELAGLRMLSERHGRLSWRRVVMPAVRLARDGLPTPWFLGTRVPEVLPRLPAGAIYQPLRDLIAPGGTPRRWGDPLVRPALARTLATLAADPGAFYRGPIADDIVATVTAGGGVLTAADLAAYQVTERTPMIGRWRGLTLATMPLPSSGGVVLLEALGILDRTGLDVGSLGLGSAPLYHVIAEIEKHGFADRARLLGDSDEARAAAAGLLDDARLKQLAARVSIDHVQPIASYGLAAGAAPPASGPTAPRPPTTGRLKGPGGTTHLCVIDRDGNAVSLTTTVNGYFGSKLVTAGGVVLNNQIDDFALAPDAANMFDLVQSTNNLVGPGKRPLSSMTPLLVLDGDRVVGCLGGSGGPRIISNVLQVFLDVFALGLHARTAVEIPRVHHQWSPDELIVEEEVPPEVRAALAARGHHVVVSDAPTGVQVIHVRADGLLEAASDPRKNGAPAAAP